MNHSEQSPIEKLNPHEKWYRFNSLPFKIQERIVELLVIARGDGLSPTFTFEHDGYSLQQNSDNDSPEERLCQRVIATVLAALRGCLKS